MIVRTCSSPMRIFVFLALAPLMSCVSVGPSMPASLADVADVDVVDVANLPPAPRDVRAEQLLMAVVLRFEERDGEPVTTEYVLERTRVLNRQGQRDRAAVLSYDLTFDEVLRHRAWVHDPDGGVVEIRHRHQ